MSESVKGLKQAGNVNLYTVPHIVNPDGTQSSVHSTSFGQDGNEILVPGMNSQHLLSAADAEKQYQQTGKYLGIFDSIQSADQYAQQLHNNYASNKLDVPLATTRHSVDPNQLEMVLKGLLQSGPYIDPYQVKR